MPTLAAILTLSPLALDLDQGGNAKAARHRDYLRASGAVPAGAARPVNATPERTSLTATAIANAKPKAMHETWMLTSRPASSLKNRPRRHPETRHG
jgi:hypothetical protein